MSPFYVKHFKVKNPCPICPNRNPSSGAPGKALCARHLTKAKLEWRVWGAERRDQGLCNACDRRGVLDRATGIRNCRCKAHREQNRLRCLRWMSENPGANAKAWEKRKALLDSGVCICPMRTVLRAGERRCDDCRAYQKALDKGDTKTLTKIRLKRYNARVGRYDTMAQEASRQLVA